MLRDSRSSDETSIFVDERKNIQDKNQIIVTYLEKCPYFTMVNDYLRFALKILFTGGLRTGAPFDFQTLTLLVLSV